MILQRDTLLYRKSMLQVRGDRWAPLCFERRKTMKKILSLLLALVMLTGMLPRSVFAVEDADSVLASENSEASYVRMLPQETNIETVDAYEVVQQLKNGGSVAELVTLPNGQGAHTHTYIPAITRPNGTEQGYTTYTCTCGDFYRTLWQDKDAYKGKTIACIGDSITAGTGTTKMYFEYLAESIGFGSVIPMGVTGSCISAASDYGQSNQPLINRYQNIPSADLIVIFMGTNDYGHETPLGSVEDTRDGTFYGALNVIIPDLVANHPFSKIVFVTPMHRYGFGTSKLLGTPFLSDDVANGVGATLGDYVDALKLVCANNDVSVIDLYTECTLDPADADIRRDYMPDGLHPNAAGHEVIAGIMEAHIRTFEPAEQNPGELTEMVYGNRFATGNNQTCRASSLVNYYLKAGTVITLKDSAAMQWACTKTSDETSSNNLGYFPDSGWSDKETAVVETDGWVGFVFKYRDETETFDLTKPLIDYITIEVPHSHTYTPIVTMPTGFEKGYTKYTCNCGESYRTAWLEPSAYEGKTIACIGDSITAAYGVTKDETDYVKVLAEQLGMNYIRLGDSGTTLCTDGSRTCNIRRLTEGYLQGADVVTIAMGINDFCAAGAGYYKLGDINSTDSSTIYGAARMWCERIEDLRKDDNLSDTQFYFLTPVIASWNSSVTSVRNWDQSKKNIHGYTLRDLCNAIIEVAELYDVEVIDLNLLSGMYYVSAEDNNTAVFGGDGVHPGEVGHTMMANAIVNILLQNDLRDDHTHTFGSWITTTWASCLAGEQQRVCSSCSVVERRTLEPVSPHSYTLVVTVPTCTEKGYTTYTCTCGERFVDDYTDMAEHSYVGGICTGCGEIHPNMVNFEGKVISIMGDSISTFAGYIPVADGFNREHLARYPQDNLLTDVNDTWWMQVIVALDAQLGINDSWRGATVSGAAAVTSGDSGENAAMSNLTRIQNLGSNGTPDVILFYGGTNDLAHVAKVGTFDPATVPSAVDLTTTKWDNLADGYVHTLLRMQYYYPDAVIVAMLPTYTASYYSNEKLTQANETLAQICQYYGVACVDLRECGITVKNLPDGIHPDAEGMDMITQAVLDALLTRCEMEAGEHVVHSVKHSLTNATASLGHYKGISTGKAFTETLDGDNLTVKVTMGGVDITETCYAEGKISIDTVTGDLLIFAEGSLLGNRLQQLPEQYWTMDLWPALEHSEEYYSATGWGVHSSGKVKSVTIPVADDQIILASSFGASGENGGPLNGIRVTFFTDTGVLVSMTADQVYEQFSEKGYMSVPEGATAVCVPMWTEEHGELYVLPLSKVTAPENFTYTLDEQAGTVLLTKYTGADTSVTVERRYMVEGKLYSTVLKTNAVFYGNENLTRVKICAGVGFQNNSMAHLFSGCKNLTTVDMTGVDTSNITNMKCLFDWCSKLSSIIGYECWDTGSLLNINKMFNRTTSLKTVDLSKWDLSQVVNSGWCFQNCYASQILLPDNLKTMSAGFLNHAINYAGTSFTIPAGVQKIGYAHTIYDFATNDFVEFRVAEGNEHYVAVDGILYSADGTEMLAIPRNKAFANNTYEIPEGVTFLGELSFSRNYNIHKLILPNSFVIENVPLYDENYIVFEDTGNLNSGTNLSIAIYCYTGITEYEVKEDNPNYSSLNGIIYSKDMTEVVAIPARYDQHIVVPEGVTVWNTEAMWADLAGNSNIPSLLAKCDGVSIPASLVSMDAAQMDLLNLLVEKGNFTITVDKDNKVYCVDADGKLTTHTFTSVVTEATCTQSGYTTHTCDCGYSYKDSDTSATGHSHSRYGHDQMSHWSICACGAAMDKTMDSHTYSNDRCVCGATCVAVVVKGNASYTVSGQIVTVTCDLPCAVGYLDGDHQKYVAISAIQNQDGSHSFTAPDGVAEVLIVIMGNTNGDNRVSVSDIAALNAHLQEKKCLEKEALFAADVNNDGKLDENDMMVLSSVLLGKDSLSWKLV